MATFIFLCKNNDQYADKAFEYLEQHFPNSIKVSGTRGEEMPNVLKNWKGDYLISYLSPWIVPQKILDQTKIASINLHPGPPEYPGIGCTNFAIYDSAKEFGITCHHMLSKVDTGNIIEVRRFPVFETDTVMSITQRCYAKIVESFYALVEVIKSGKPLPVSSESWQRKAYTRKQLNELCRITIDMTEAEMQKRIKATTYDKTWAFIEFHGKKFKLDN